MAALFGGIRTGPQGRNLPDVRMPDGTPMPDGVGIEVKAYAKLALKNEDMEQAKRNAGVGNPWVLIVRENKTGRKVAYCDPEYLGYLYCKAHGLTPITTTPRRSSTKSKGEV